jgi:hypothetical protein
VNAVMNVRAVLNEGKSLSSWATGGFSRRTRLHGYCTMQVLTAVVVNSSDLWNTRITPCSLLKKSRRFGGTCLSHRSIQQARNQHEAGSKLSVCVGFLLGLFFDLEDGGEIFLQNVTRLSAYFTSLYPRRFLVLYCVWNIFVVASSSYSDVIGKIFLESYCSVLDLFEALTEFKMLSVIFW